MTSDTIPVLDYGYVRLIDSFGTDEDIVRAARISYDRQDPDKAARLIDYLLRNRHTSPFEMCEIKVEIKAPLFVVAQIVRHRTANINQLSMRYTTAPDESYLPLLERIKGKDPNNKQGSAEALPPVVREAALADMADAMRIADETYKRLIGHGVAPEIARIVLPVARYTRLVWKIDLHNLLHFLRLRMDKHAQQECREYANALYEIASHLWPMTMEAWDRHANPTIELRAIGTLWTVVNRWNRVTVHQTYADAQIWARNEYGAVITPFPAKGQGPCYDAEGAVICRITKHA